MKDGKFANITSAQGLSAGGALMTMQIARKVLDYLRESRKSIEVTPGEFTIIGFIAKGYSYPEIGDTLGIAVVAVRQSLRAIYKKLQKAGRGSDEG